MANGHEKTTRLLTVLINTIRNRAANELLGFALI
jgi:hypothetical protein